MSSSVNIDEQDKKWYELLPCLETKKSTNLQSTVTASILKAESIFKQESEKVIKRQNESDVGDFKYMRNMIKNGTLSDKVSAMSILIQSDPIHNLSTIETLFEMAQKKGKREAQAGINALVTLFSEYLLPDRTLFYFSEEPLTDSRVNNKYLVSFYFEHKLKLKYTQFLELLVQYSHDPMTYFKKNALLSLFNLINKKPEQEQFILTSLVTRLADKERQISSHVVYLLNRLLSENPFMRPTVAKEVRLLLIKNDITLKTIYNGLIFLNQIEYISTDGQFIEDQILFFLSIFKKYVIDEEKEQETMKQINELSGKEREKALRKYINKKKDNKELETSRTKILSALLTGINRAIPFSDSPLSVFTEYLDSMYRVVYDKMWSCSIQALILLYTITTKHPSEFPRFYRCVYASLIKFIESKNNSTSKYMLYFNLLFKIMKYCQDETVLNALIKRIQSICLYTPSNIACGLLYLISTALKERKEVSKLSNGLDQLVALDSHGFISRPEVSLKPIEHILNNEKDTNNNDIDENSEEEEESDNNSEHDDDEEEEDEEEEESEDDDNKKDGVSNSSEIDANNKKDENDDDDDDDVQDITEDFLNDIDDDVEVMEFGDENDNEEEEEEEKEKEEKKEKKVKKQKKSKKIEKENKPKKEIKEPSKMSIKISEDEMNKYMQLAQEKQIVIDTIKQENIDMTPLATLYTSTKRDPAYSNSLNTRSYELILLSNHYHPSVAKFASILLQGQYITYDSDPIQDFSNRVFLDKFSYKRPKQKDIDNARKRGFSKMGRNIISKAAISIPLNDPKFLKLKEEDVNEDDLFFYKYFKEKARREGPKIKKSKLEEEEEEEEYATKLAQSLMKNNDDEDVDFSMSSDDDDNDNNNDLSDIEEEEDDDDDETDKKKKKNIKKDKEDEDEDEDDMYLDEFGDALEGADDNNEEISDLEDNENDINFGEELFNDDLNEDNVFEESSDDDDDDDDDNDDDNDDDDNNDSNDKKKKKFNKKSKTSKSMFIDEFGDEEESKQKTDKKKKGVQSIFASADDYAELLESAGKEASREDDENNDDDDHSNKRWGKKPNRKFNGKRKNTNDSYKPKRRPFNKKFNNKKH
ncbi:hypothetical protein WA158_008066 [Blastocystis sp. Blastoise]